jgi:hypothetical protein
MIEEGTEIVSPMTQEFTQPPERGTATATQQVAVKEMIVEKGDLYPFNADSYEIPINVAPIGYPEHWTIHRLARLENEWLLERERGSSTKSVPAGNGENVLKMDADEPNANLYNRALLAVKGLTASGEWVSVTPDLLRRIKFGWKVTAVSGYHYGTAKVIWSPEELYVDSNNESLKQVRLEIGAKTVPDFTIDFYLKAPGELDIAFYRTNSVQIRTQRGERVGGTKLVTDLRIASRLFEALFVKCDGGGIVVNGEVVAYNDSLRQDFLKAIDYEWQSKVVEALMTAEQGSLLD